MAHEWTSWTDLPPSIRDKEIEHHRRDGIWFSSLGYDTRSGKKAWEHYKNTRKMLLDKGYDVFEVYAGKKRDATSSFHAVFRKSKNSKGKVTSKKHPMY